MAPHPCAPRAYLLLASEVQDLAGHWSLVTPSVLAIVAGTNLLTLLGLTVLADHLSGSCLNLAAASLILSIWAAVNLYRQRRRAQQLVARLHDAQAGRARLL